MSTTEEQEFRNEEWKQIYFEEDPKLDKYQISNYGRVKSFTVSTIGKILKGGLVNGYRALHIKTKAGLVINKYIHKLVAESFCEEPKKGQKFVIHTDYNKTNNYMLNLGWVSRQELMEHMSKNPNPRKRRTTGYKLDEAKVRVIKGMLKRNKTRLSVIARQFGITHTQLNRIRSGENWSHVTID
ncbi:MAG: hypothetical protein ACJAUV_000040 [Flavobacteriales bacterium]|jgi:hypothetical protein